MGHTLHHQGLNLDEELLHAEREHDRALAEDAVEERRRADRRAAGRRAADARRGGGQSAPEPPAGRDGR
jgi:hypothetical protein